MMIHSLARASYGILVLTIKIVILMAGATIIVGLVFGEADGPPRDLGSFDSETRHVRDNRGRIIFSLEDEGTDDSSKFILRDKEGNRLMQGKIYQDKRMIFSLGDEMESGLVRSVGYMSTNGKIGLGVWNGRTHYKLSACKDGSSEVELVDPDMRVFYGFRVTPEGDLIHDLPDVIGEQ